MDWALNVLRQVWEPYSFNQIEKYGDKSKNFLDLGAWIGPLTCFASYHFDRVFAIEPDPVAYKQLQQNTEGMNVTLIREAIGPKGVLFGAFGDSSASIIDNGTKGIEVSHLSLSELLNKYDIDNIGLVKIDIEGAEKYAIEELINHFSNVPVMYSHHGYESASVDRLADVWELGDVLNIKDRISQIGNLDFLMLPR